jgi:hypothetical protein
MARNVHLLGNSPRPTFVKEGEEFHSMKTRFLAASSAITFVIIGVTTLWAQKHSTAVSITGYKKWVRINPKPHRVTSYLAFLCRYSTPEKNKREQGNPHNDKWVTVYVNSVARRAMLEQQKPKFPRGSLIIKEKLTAADSKTPELLTVMHKREKGFNPKNGDWEYLVYDGAGTKVKAQGKLQNCQSCHASWKTTDYVSRVYLTEATLRKLR